MKRRPRRSSAYINIMNVRAATPKTVNTADSLLARSYAGWGTWKGEGCGCF